MDGPLGMPPFNPVQMALSIQFLSLQDSLAPSPVLLWFHSVNRNSWHRDLCWCPMCVPSHFRHVQLFATPWTAAFQAPVSIGFSRQEYWSGLPLPPPENLPNPRDWTHVSVSPALAGGFFTISATWSLQILDPFLSLELGVSAVTLQWCFLFHSHSSSLHVPCLPATLCYLLSPSPLLSSSWTHPHCSFLLEDQGTGSSSIIIPTLASLRTYASFEAHLRFCFPLRALPLLPTGYESQNDMHLLWCLPYLTSCHDVCTCVIVALDVNFL